MSEVSTTEKPADQRVTPQRWTVLLTACFGVFLCFGSVVVFTFGVFLKPVSQTFGWSRTQFSLAFMIAALMVAICSPILGHLLDRYPARRIVLPCTLVYGATFASLALLTPNIWHLYAVFAVLGIVANGTTQLPYGRVVSAWFDENRGQALAAVIAGSGLGSMVFPPLAQALIDAYGWRTAYAVLGVAILAVALPLAALFLREPDSERPDLHSRRVKTSGVWSGRFLGIAFALLLFSFASNGLNTHWVALLTDGGASAKQAAMVLSIAGAATLLGKLGTGALIDRFRAGRVAAALFTLCAGGFVLVLVPYLWSLAILSAVLVGVAMGAESDVVPYLLTRYFGLEQFGTLYGYTWCVYALSAATGPVVMGAVYDHTGSYRAVLMVSLAMVIVSALTFGLLPAYPKTSVHKRR